MMKRPVALWLALLFLVFLAAPASAEDIELTTKDIQALEAKAKQGRADAKNILEQYRKQQAEKAAKKDAPENEGVIGTIMEVEGDATITTEGREPAEIAVDTPVHLNDVVETGKGARVFILFIDNTEMTLSENTKLAVDEWVFNPDDNTEDKGVYSILKGTFLYVSGLIAKKENPDVQVNTPVGSIGIRGTVFWGGDIDDTYGILVNKGRVNVKTDAGQVTVEEGQGTSVRDRKAPPAAVKTWAPEKITRATATVKLRQPEQVRERVVKQQVQNKALSVRYREFLDTQRTKARPQPMLQKPQQKTTPSAPAQKGQKQIDPAKQKQLMDQMKDEELKNQLRQKMMLDELKELQRQELYNNQMDRQLHRLF